MTVMRYFRTKSSPLHVNNEGVAFAVAFRAI